MTKFRFWLGFTSISLGFSALFASACGGSTVEPPLGSGGQADTGGGSGGQETAESGGQANASGGAGGENGDLLIDDFEDHDTTPLVGLGWYEYTDQENGGLSTATLTIPEVGEGSTGSLLYEYSLDRGALEYDPYVGTGVVLASGAGMDLSQYSSIRYLYKGAAHTVRLQTSDVTDYDYFGVVVPASSTWTTVELPFVLFAQEGWGTSVPFDPTHVNDISFHMRGPTGTTNALAIDDVYVSHATADFPLEVLDPMPPELVVLDPLTIENPLQQLAVDHLSRGANIDSWLEAGRFDGFDYDESYVQKLADAGFKSLRLPIDFDLYVESVTGTAPDLTLELHEDLFTILDSFEEWTAQSGMSLTIDYHQYDRSLDFGKQDTKDLAVALWGAVAEHFADNPREDLFFELLNEPELSVGGVPPNSGQWTLLAEEMIAAIRVHDTERVILFGDVEYYGITPLSRRKLLSDDRIIYVFHFYDPFLFSHQGAGWTDLLALHDVPYPYTKERWPENGLDLGINERLPAWVLTQVDEYYKTGNKNWMYNRISTAKKWAITNNVPVICNEFGIYEPASQPADRVAYYTDLIDIFEEQEIPWQVWFRIMDEDGVVIPEYRAAFGLDE